MEDIKRYEIMKDIVESKAHELYGKDLPEVVKHRILDELDLFNRYGHIRYYYLLTRVYEDMGVIEEPHNVRRQTAGSSFVAYLCGINDTNPLRAHYRCEEGHYISFTDEDKHFTLLPSIKCPICNKTLIRDGYNIPFEFQYRYLSRNEAKLEVNVRYSKMNMVKERLNELAKEEDIIVGNNILIRGMTSLDAIHIFENETGIKASDIPLCETTIEIWKSVKVSLCDIMDIQEALHSKRNYVHPKCMISSYSKMYWQLLYYKTYDNGLYDRINKEIDFVYWIKER